MRSRKAVLLTLAFALLGVAPASAAVRYASSAGSGSTCTAAAPCSLMTAVHDAPASSEIVVSPDGAPYSVSATIGATAAGLDIHGVAGRPRPQINSAITGVCCTVHPAISVQSASSVRHLAIGMTGDYTMGVGEVSGNGTLDDLVITGSGGNEMGAWVMGNNSVMTQLAIHLTGTIGTGLLFQNGSGAVIRGVSAVADGAPSYGLSIDASSTDTAVSILDTIARGSTTDVSTAASPSYNLAVAIDYSNYQTASSAGVTAGSHNQSATPLFADAALHEQPGSPTIDAGTADPDNDATDFDGEARQIGPAPDIGVDEIAEAPAASASTATGVTQTAATLPGSVNPDGAQTAYHFVYGTTTAYGQQTAPGDAGSGTAAQPVGAAIGGLSPNTTYHYELVATNALGTTASADHTFTTPPTARKAAACKVPNLHGKTLRAAKRALRHAHCKLGKVRKKKVRSVHPGRVSAQSKRPGRTLKHGARIGITLARR